jgi:hypothetical protein
MKLQQIKSQPRIGLSNKTTFETLFQHLRENI